jgi:hypothetical protein
LADGTPDATCGAGSFANPYWNAPVESLLDPSSRFAVYSRYSTSAILSGSNQSYIPPHLAALVTNYKHGRLNITPSFQFQAGARYGRPLSTPGIDPAAGCAARAGSTTNDPRYPYGAAGGAPFDAATCNPSPATFVLSIPDPYTGHFDRYGEYREPNVLSGNLGISYDISRRAKVSLLGVNLLSSCWGGSRVPWQLSGRAGCNYGSQSGAYIGNLYNPGDQLVPLTQYPYNPTFVSAGGLQQNTGGNALFPQFFMTVQVKL